jgi:predicted dehydrogenase
MRDADRPLRLAVIGLGFGRAVHLPTFCSMKDVSVVAVGAARRAKAEEAAAAFGIPQAFDDIPALLSQPLDAVSLALPPAASAAIARQALERGLAVLAEKPLAGSAAEASVLAQRAGNGLTAVVDFTFPELAAFRRLKEILRQGTLGAVRGATIRWMTYSYAHRNGVWSWKVDADRHGGVMTAQGSHVLHLLDWLFGPLALDHARLERRATEALAPPGAHAADDGAELVFRIAGGASVTAALSNATPDGGPHRWEVVCDDATIIVENQGTGIMGGFGLTVRDRAGHVIASEPPEAAGATDDRLAPFGRLAARFVAAARQGEPCQPDFAAGARAQDLMEQVFAMDARRSLVSSAPSPGSKS